MTIEQAIEQYGFAYHHIKGISMLPLIREGKDQIVIFRKPEQRLRKYDLPVFKRKNGEYVIHRIMKVHDGGYDIVGDNQCFYERNVTDDQIIGVVTQIMRGNKMISVNRAKNSHKTTWWYSLYIFLWCDLFFLRAPLVWVEYKLIAIRRKLLK